MPQETATRGKRIALGVGVGVVAALVGFFSFALLPFAYVLTILGLALAAVGTVGVVLRQPWGAPLLGAGAGLVAGQTAYVVLGILQPDGPACGGTGCP
ncbi:hypothetical protein [Microbacterium ulmi]|uniref:Uncharacterized protein n=1 Tax=Microbacterium ulmi TaxID=179095 RepID=A0A7Y2M319_9MICO|nr:hypothetical protein [Microbacterium ulmi]NII68781.1 uncharacterized protein (DUF2062 family) [Microbacterium ulmi]NNH05392.1 hypothetical protein [Microbacterium ulmi]